MFVDEAQDFNEAQRELIRKCVKGGRCIIVGDKNQAIYGGFILLGIIIAS